MERMVWFNNRHQLVATITVY